MGYIEIEPFVTPEEKCIYEALERISLEKLTKDQRARLVAFLKEIGVLSDEFVDGNNYVWKWMSEAEIHVAVKKGVKDG